MDVCANVNLAMFGNVYKSHMDTVICVISMFYRSSSRMFSFLISLIMIWLHVLRLLLLAHHEAIPSTALWNFTQLKKLLWIVYSKVLCEELHLMNDVLIMNLLLGSTGPTYECSVNNSHLTFLHHNYGFYELLKYNSSTVIVNIVLTNPWNKLEDFVHILCTILWPNKSQCLTSHQTVGNIQTVLSTFYNRLFESF